MSVGNEFPVGLTRLEPFRFIWMTHFPTSDTIFLLSFSKKLRDGDESALHHLGYRGQLFECPLFTPQLHSLDNERDSLALLSRISNF